MMMFHNESAEHFEVTETIFRLNTWLAERIYNKLPRMMRVFSKISEWCFCLRDDQNGSQIVSLIPNWSTFPRLGGDSQGWGPIILWGNWQVHSPWNYGAWETIDPALFLLGPNPFRTAFAVRFREGTTSVKWLRLVRCITRSSEGRGAADPESIFCFWGDRTVQQKKTNWFELMVLTQKVQCHNMIKIYTSKKWELEGS